MTTLIRRGTLLATFLLTSTLLAQEPARTAALTQGYTLVNSDPVRALASFQLAHRLSPSDTLQLQIAYLLNGLGRVDDAVEAFQALTRSPISAFRERAATALYVIDDLRRAQRAPTWLRVSSAALSDSRFRTEILWATVQGGYRLTEDQSVNAVASMVTSADTRSTGGQLPVLYSDNVWLLLTGLRWTPSDNSAIDVEGGQAYDLRVQGTRSRWRGDFRAVASYGTGIYPLPTRTDRARLAGDLFADAGVSAGYYSRYENVIGFFQGRAGMRAAEWGPSALDLYLRSDVVADTRHVYSNNLVEGGIGVRVVPDHAWGAAVHAEWRRGTYLGGSRTSAPGGAWFSTFRLMVVMEKYL